MIFDSEVHSIKKLKVKKENVKENEDFVTEIKVVGLEVITSGEYFLIPLDHNSSRRELLTKYALATAYNLCKSFDLEIEIQD